MNANEKGFLLSILMTQADFADIGFLLCWMLVGS